MDKTWLNAAHEESSTRVGYDVDSMEAVFQDKLEQILKLLIELNDGNYLAGLVATDKVFKTIIEKRNCAIRNNYDMRQFSTRFVPNVSLNTDGNTPRYRFGLRYIAGRLPVGKRLPRDVFKTRIKTKFFAMGDGFSKADKWNAQLLRSEPDWAQEEFCDLDEKFKNLNDRTRLIREIRNKIYELSRSTKRYHDIDRKKYPDMNDLFLNGEGEEKKDPQSLVLNAERYREIVKAHTGKTPTKKITKQDFEDIVDSLYDELDDLDRPFHDYRSSKEK